MRRSWVAYRLVAFDPYRTWRGLKSRSAAACSHAIGYASLVGIPARASVATISIQNNSRYLPTTCNDLLRRERRRVFRNKSRATAIGSRRRPAVRSNRPAPPIPMKMMP